MATLGKSVCDRKDLIIAKTFLPETLIIPIADFPYAVESAAMVLDEFILS